jgi:hypothetical protein
MSAFERAVLLALIWIARIIVECHKRSGVENQVTATHFLDAMKKEILPND